MTHSFFLSKTEIITIYLYISFKIVIRYFNLPQKTLRVLIKKKRKQEKEKIRFNDDEKHDNARRERIL